MGPITKCTILLSLPRAPENKEPAVGNLELKGGFGTGSSLSDCPLEQRLAETDAFINNSNEGDGNLETKLTLQEQLKKELQYIYEKKGEGALFRSKLRWTEQGEKPTRYFSIWRQKILTRRLFLSWKPARGLK